MNKEIFDPDLCDIIFEYINVDLQIFKCLRTICKKFKLFRCYNKIKISIKFILDNYYDIFDNKFNGKFDSIIELSDEELYGKTINSIIDMLDYNNPIYKIECIYLPTRLTRDCAIKDCENYWIVRKLERFIKDCYIYFYSEKGGNYLMVKTDSEYNTTDLLYKCCNAWDLFYIDGYSFICTDCLDIKNGAEGFYHTLNIEDHSEMYLLYCNECKMVKDGIFTNDHKEPIKDRCALCSYCNSDYI